MPTLQLALSRTLLAGAWTRDKSRALLAVFAIALGVALGFAVQLITTAAVNEMQAGVHLLSGDADLEVRGPRAGFAEATYATLAQLPQVADASPVLEVDAKLAGREDSLTVLGIDVFRAAGVQPALVPTPRSRLALFQPDAIFLSPAAARWLGLVGATDATITVQVGLRDRVLQVAGDVGANANQRIAVMDIAAAQLVFGRLGVISRVDLRLAPGVDSDAFARQLQHWVPAGVVVERPEASLAASARASRAYRVNMTVLALVALFTGALLVFSTQALAVVRRRAQLALLRVLGVTRGQVQRMLLAEGMLVGIVGSALGLLGGYGLAQFAVRHLGADLGSGALQGAAGMLPVPAWAVAAYFTIGVGVAVIASVLPARAAAYAAPALALKAGDDERGGAHRAWFWFGVVALVGAVIAAFAPPLDGLPWLGYLSIALLLAGVLLLLPAVTGGLLQLVPISRHAAPALAVTQLRGTPGSAAVSLAAIVASVSLMVSMAIMVNSFRDALTDWLAHILPADAYVRAASSGDTGFLDATDQARLAALPGVTRAEFQREQQLLLDPGLPRATLLARSIDEADPGARLPLVGGAITPAANAPPPAWISEAMVDLYGMHPGQVIDIPLNGSAVPFTAAGVWRDYARQQGSITIDRRRYIALTGDGSASGAALWLAPGTSKADIEAAIAHDIPGGERLEVATTGEIRNVSLQIFDRTFAVTYALELAAVAIGLLGLSSSFGALVIARRREFGVLRHLGMTRRQVGVMLAVEGLVIASIGLIVGLVLGCAISIILIQVVNRQSFHFGMGFAVPWLSLAGFALIFLALATLTAVVAGRSAMRSDIVQAVRDDW